MPIFFYWSVAQLSWTFCDPMDCSTPGFPVLHYLPEFTQIHVHWVNDAIQPSHLVTHFSSCLQSFSVSCSFPMRWLFTSHGWSIGASALASVFEYLGSISFRIDWSELAVQGMLKSLLQHHSSKASIIRCSAFFRGQLSRPYMTTGKTIALTRQTFVGKIMSLLFKMLSVYQRCIKAMTNKDILKLWPTLLFFQGASAFQFHGCSHHLQWFLEPKKIKHHPSAENWIKDLLSMALHQSKTQFSSKSVPPIRKLAQTSYPPLSECRQNKNHNHSKLTKMSTWITALSNSMKLWVMPCRVTQDQRVMVESSDKRWSTGEGNGNHFSILVLRTPWIAWNVHLLRN